MLIEAKEVAVDGHIATDVCIVGAGPAGLTLASSLDGCGFRVAVVEAGGEAGPPRGLVDGRVTASSTDFEAPPMMFDRLGGGANEWIVRLPWHRRGVRMLPLAPIDFEARPWIENSGWPFPYGELEPYYRRAQRLLDLAPRGDAPGDWEGDGATRCRWRTVVSPPPWSGSPARGCSPNNSSANCATHPTSRCASGLTSVSSKGPADRVEWAELDVTPSGRIRVDARVFVLAAGGIETRGCCWRREIARPTATATMWSGGTTWTTIA